MLHVLSVSTFITKCSLLFFYARLNHIGLFLNGLAGPVALSAPPLVSAYWFPPKQRTTATALTSLAAYYGVSFSFVIGPVLVPDRNETNSSLLRYITAWFIIPPYISSLHMSLFLRWKDCNLTLQNFTDCQSKV